jgi:hypothetical protein
VKRCEFGALPTRMSKVLLRSYLHVESQYRILSSIAASRVLTSRLSLVTSRLTCYDWVMHQCKVFGAGVLVSVMELGSKTKRVEKQD